MKLLILVLTFLSLNGFSQDIYWQQELHYLIDVKLNESSHTLSGNMTVDYINHSPDTLHFVWFHLWPNGYKNSNTAFSKQLARLKDRSVKAGALAENGFIDSLNFSVDGKTVSVEEHPENIDIVKVLLPSPLFPGNKFTIATPFKVKVPSYASRMGFSGDMYMISQWYPKPAVYDRKGWHPIPYLDQGEFYSDYGSFKVNITVPSVYVIGATGELLNKDESDKYKAIGKSNLQLANKNGNRIKWDYYRPSNPSGFKTLSYQADNVHDFAWFADKDFVIQYDTLQLPSSKTIDAFSFFQPDGNREWKNSVSFIKDAVSRYSGWIGEYAYPVVNAVEGPANGSSGGMEYPMITLITSPDANKERLDAVITHEVGHNWFYGILGSNERDHAWMDEGINSYYQFRYEAEKYKTNSIFENQIPREVKEKPIAAFEGIIYNAIAQLPMKSAIETPSANFTSSEEYGVTVYVKAAMWMYVMELALGREGMEKAMHDYFSDWKFKHPYPEDMEKSFEQSSGKGLQDVFSLLQKEGSFK